MKILFLALEAVLGGHVLSALTIARGLKKRGHAVMFAAGPGKLASVIEQEMPFFEVSIPYFHDRQEICYTYFTWKSFPAIAHIKNLAETQAVDMLHAFDARTYLHTQIVGLLTGIPVSCTLCGGIDPHYNIPIIPKVMVFSEEQKNKLVQRYGWSEKRVEIVRTRLDLDQILAAQAGPPEQLLADLGVKTDRPKIMMISSFDPTKINSVMNVLEAVTGLFEKGLRFQMVFIGGEGALFEELQARAGVINAELGEPGVVFTGPVLNAYRLLASADIVLGVGRSAFEGMSYAKPTMVVGENGFAGIVSPEAVAEIAYYNFSGRNRKDPCPPEILAQNIASLLADQDRQKAIGNFGKKFVMEEIDVKLGLSKIEEIYQINMRARSLPFEMLQWWSVFKCMVPIWRDNVYHTVSFPIKQALGKI